MSDLIRLAIRHVTGFSYDGAADSSYNEARMTPLTRPTQRVLAASLTISPYALQSTYRDYFGTIVTTFDLHESHRRLEVVAEAEVAIEDVPAPDADIPLAELRDDALYDRFVEYLSPTPHTTLSERQLDSFRETTRGARFARDVVDAALATVRDHMTYVRGATVVTSSAQDAWDEGKGVCQDLTHVTLALLRSAGVPARYVSGYLHSDLAAGVGVTVAGESHAWVEYFAGEWRGVDPTNDGVVGLGHVIVATGREYEDVTPLKGIYHGDPASALGVSVETTRLA